MMVVNNPLIRSYFLGGVELDGVPLDSHDCSSWKEYCLQNVFSV